MQNLWVSPRGREYAVANHTSWLEKLFRTPLPPIEDVEHEIEKDKLYDWAVQSNWLRARIDQDTHALYVDPNPLTGDQWRWLARCAASNHLLAYNSDGKELANFQPGKRKKQRTVEHRLMLGMGAKAYVSEAIEGKDATPEEVSAPESVKDWLMKQPKPSYRDSEYRVIIYLPTHNAMYSYKTMEMALGKAVYNIQYRRANLLNYQDMKPPIIQHYANDKLLSAWTVTPGGGLVPAPISEGADIAKDFIMQTPAQPAHWPADLPPRVWQTAMAMLNMGVEIITISQPIRDGVPVCDEILIDHATGISGLLSIWREDSGHRNHNLHVTMHNHGSWVLVADEGGPNIDVLLRKLNYAVKIVVPKVRTHGKKEGARQAEDMMARFRARVGESFDPKEFMAQRPVGESVLCESSEFKTLKAKRQSLSAEEKAEAGDAPIWKAVVAGITWYVSNTHRAFQADKTIKAAVKSYRDVVEPSG